MAGSRSLALLFALLLPQLSLSLYEQNTLIAVTSRDTLVNVAPRGNGQKFGVARGGVVSANITLTTRCGCAPEVRTVLVLLQLLQLLLLLLLLLLLVVLLLLLVLVLLPPPPLPPLTPVLPSCSGPGDASSRHAGLQVQGVCS